MCQVLTLWRCSSCRHTPQLITGHVNVSVRPSDITAMQVRKHAGEQLYLQLLGEDDEDGALDDALATLSETAWDGNAGLARAARDRLFAPLRVQPPKSHGLRVADVVHGDHPAGSSTGYAGLLVDAAREQG